jgi:hypothetical protein
MVSGGVGEVGPGKLRIWTEVSFQDDASKTAKGELTIDLAACSYLEMAGRMSYDLRRAERYLALCAGHQIPIAYELQGPGVPSISMNQTEVFLTSAMRWELPTEIKEIYQSADGLLRAFPDDSYVAKAIESVGATALTNDMDACFVNAWNGIELLAKEYRYERDPTLSRVAADGQRHDPLKVGVIVSPLIADFHDGDNPPNLDWLAYLRNGSAHGGLSNYPGKSEAEYWERWDKSEAVRDLAYEVLINYLSKHGAIPSVTRPVHRRISVPSLRKDWKVTPVDESSKLE